MTFLYATKGRRFLTYLIDFVLLSIISSYLGRYIERLAGFDPDSSNAYYQLAMTELNNFISGGNASQENIMHYLQQYYIHSLIDRVFNLGVLFVLIVGLLVVLPIFWHGKTLGRKLTHLTLVDQKGKPATTKNFILREIVGTFLFYGLFGSVAIIVTLILLLVKNRSLVDYISATHLVFDTEYIENVRGYTMKNEEANTSFEDDNVVKADYTEVNNDSNDDQENDSDDDYRII